ncbi:Xaa-Pro peptidase family protein [Shewanella sp. D64]|uniref:M24 family metallopeptidase n=1 Tax=unclassified Shewanella TaxID=196818 RepID=UPI0022BA2851|nr:MULTISPECIES: Xaa-Pro peptidase family protein [unclassified Shewanella]MEC4727563.1 Xaa-Pro peptidase family protein [Shewanella sp. D64]MEC4739814.1 Xaa-Pro peptidase family protein [Shewanella sp. E94]WBJ95798.1 Xaa-Pro peptidase family protein [Shewanella sp. MTB7]
MKSILQRGFTTAEFEMRAAKAQQKMRELEVDAILLTTEPNVRYFSGFHTQFWHSPTRPWFLILPAEGKPIAVIPEIGASGMASTWVEDIHTWASPRPEDDGISIVASVLNSLPSRFGRVGATLGIESHLRMPVSNYLQLTTLVSKEFVDVSLAIHDIRQVKSVTEIEKVREICRITNVGFDKIPDYAKAGMTERQICKQFGIDMLMEGADECPYIIAGSGQDGYDSIIMGPTDRVIETGDVLIIDTGAVRDGYFSDFDRNWAFGHASEQTKAAYRATYEATTMGFKAARPGNTTSDIYNAMWKVLEANGALGNDVGRLGHGLGIELTERPSNTATDNTILVPGMVMTLEPGMVYAPGKSMVHEENIVITENGAEWLSKRAEPELLIIK